jgi:hypothetical protein
MFRCKFKDYLKRKEKSEFFDSNTFEGFCLMLRVAKDEKDRINNIMVTLEAFIMTARVYLRSKKFMGNTDGAPSGDPRLRNLDQYGSGVESSGFGRPLSPVGQGKYFAS